MAAPRRRPFFFFDEVRDHGFDRVEFVPDVDGNPSYIHVSCDTKLKSTTKSDTTKTSEFPGAELAVRFTSETSGHLFRDMSVMEMTIRSVATLFLLATSPRRPRTQTGKWPTNSLRNITTLHGFGWLPHHRGSIWYDILPGCTSSLVLHVSVWLEVSVPASLPDTMQVGPRRFFSASRCVTSTSAEVYANVVSQRHDQRMTMGTDGVDSIHADFQEACSTREGIWHGFAMLASAWICTPMTCYLAARPVSTFYVR